MAFTQPLGIELVKRGIVKEEDITRALDFQRQHPHEKLGDILNGLGVQNPNILLNAIGEILNEKVILLQQEDIKIKMEEYISFDMMKKYLAIPFEIDKGLVKVCFADTTDTAQIESVRLLMLNRGLIMERYITFRKNIEDIINRISNAPTEINADTDATTLVDTLIRDGMKNRASDIHFEPMEKSIRVRFRIDGEMVDIAELDKEKQPQIVGRLKSLSNMYQEKQESQDGRITAYPDYNIRSSSQKNIYGEKFVLRLLKKNQTIKSLFDLGFPNDENLLKNAV